MDKILAAAKRIASARRSRSPLAALSSELVPQDEAEGYQVQRAVHDLLLPQTGSLVGYKIGCTSAVMQQYLDIPHPCGGGVFAKGVHESGAKLRFGDYVRVGVECEIAVRLARNLLAVGSAVHGRVGDGGDRGLSPRDRDRRRPLRQMGNHGRADAGGR